MRVIYIAGPFRALTQWGIAENIRAAERIGLLVALAGAMPLIPHANTANFHGIATDQLWLDGTLELLRRCDGAVFIPGWRKSKGSINEYKEAGGLSIPRLSLEETPSSLFAAVISDFLNWVEEYNNEQEDYPEEYRASVSPAADGAGHSEVKSLSGDHPSR